MIGTIESTHTTNIQERYFHEDGYVEIHAITMKGVFGHHLMGGHRIEHRDHPGNPAKTGSTYGTRTTVWGEGEIFKREEWRSQIHRTTGLSVQLQG